MLSLKAKQVAGVTLIVGLSVAASSLLQLVAIARFSLEESVVRGELLARTILQQAVRVAGEPGASDARAALKTDAGVRATLEAGIAYAPNVTYAAIVDDRGIAIAHSTPVLEGEPVPDQALLRGLLSEDFIGQLSAIYSDRTFEVREQLLTLSGAPFGAIRVGMSMLLVREELADALGPAIATTVIAVLLALVVAIGFAQWLLRPIALLRTGLARLGRGELDVKLDLPPEKEFGELGASFESVSQTLAAARSQMTGHSAQIESIVDRLEDAVAVFSPAGEIVFANPPMRAALGAGGGEAAPVATLADDHPYAAVVRRALAERQTTGPQPITLAEGGATDENGADAEHVLTAHALADHEGKFVGVMLVARDVRSRGQVQTTLRYSRKLASLNRLLAGVAHEVKNPLNAMTIHLELLKQKLGGGPEAGPDARAIDVAGVLRHQTVISQEIRRLDQVVQGFLKFSRPEELDLRPVHLRLLVDEVFGLVGAEASAHRVSLRNECPPDVPPVHGDAALLRQALLNLALNACQAMPGGGMLSIAARRARGSQVELQIADTGAGIPPADLERIFDLYFTTREGGSGLGLSMVYRTVQLHDGSIDVESVEGRGTTFRISLPEAPA